MALDRLTQITSSGITSTIVLKSSGISVSGIVTATSFVGDGSGLTGVVGSGSGVVILDDNATVGTASTINFGSNLSVSPIFSGIVTVTGTDTNTTYTQAAVASGGNVNLRLSGSDSTTDDILLTAGTNITFSNVTAGGFTISASGGGGGGGETLDQTLALGNSSSRGMSVGVLTATSLIKSGGTSSQFLKADGSVDSSTYLTTTGSGSGLSNVVNSITAGSGISVNQSTGSVTITGSGTTAIINSNSLNVSGLSTFAGVTTHTASLFGTQASFTGVVTASQFKGDGSLLTGIISQGSGITVKDDATTVGVAGTIDFGTGLTVSTLSAGIVTVTSSGGGTNYWNSTSIGLSTTSSVGIGTTNPTEKLTVYGTSGVLRALVHNTGTTGASDFVAYDLKAGSTPNHWSIYTNSVTNYFRIFDNSKGASGLRFIIDDLGDVGIGNADPLGLLHVGTGSSSLVVSSTGRVAIGTTGFAQDQDNDGTLLVKRDTGNNRLRIRNDSVSASHYASLNLKTPANAGGWSIYTNCATNYLRIFDGNFGTRLHIDADGNFGFNNTSPTRTLDVTGNAAISSNLNVAGIVTGSLVNTYAVSGNGSSFFFNGSGYTGTETNPDLYLIRGQKYRFNVTGNHPFQIQSTFGSGGTIYNNGVTNNSTVNVDFNVPYDAPDTLYYQCTVHTSGMKGKIIILGDRTIQGSWTAAAGTLQNIDTIAGVTTIGNVKTVEYTVHIEHTSGMQAQKVLVMSDGTTAYATEYGIMYQPNLLVSIGASISSGNLFLNATPETGITGVTTYRFIRQAMR